SIAPVTYWPGTASAPRLPPVTTAHSAVRNLWTRTRFRANAGDKHARTNAELVEQFRERGISLIYSNTITNGEVLAALRPLGVPVISHVHELDYWMLHRMSRSLLQQAGECTDLFIAASDAVARCLSTLLAVPEERIVTVYESIE